MDKKIPMFLLRGLEKEGARDCVINQTISDQTQVKFSNSRITGNFYWHSYSISVFAAFGKKILSTTLHEPTMKMARKTLRLLKEFSKNAHDNMQFEGIAKGPFRYKKIKSYPDPVIRKQDPRLIKAVADAIERARSNGIKRTAGVLEGTSYENNILTSKGADASQKGTSLYFSFRAFFNSIASGHMVGFSRDFSRMDFKGIVDTAVAVAMNSANPKNIRSGTYDVIFSPLAYSNIIRNVGEALSAFAVESGQSPFKGKVNKKIAGNSLTLYDDGLLSQGIFPSRYDEEGRPARKTLLIDKGVLKTFLHNTSTASRFKAKPTGNAGLVSPEPTNLVVKKGIYSKEQLFRKVKRGIYITNLWYTRFQNYQTGDFSTIPRDGAFLIENGKIKHPIRNFRITENLLRMIKNIKAIADDPKPIIGWEVESPVLCPHVLVKDVNITKPTG